MGDGLTKKKTYKNDPITLMADGVLSVVLGLGAGLSLWIGRGAR